MPTTQRKLGKGVVLGYATTQAGPFTTIGFLVDVTPPGTKVGKAESTTHDDASEQFLVGWESGKEAKFKIPTDDTQQTTLTAMIGTLQWWQFAMPGGTRKWQVQAWISDYQPNTPLKNMAVDEIALTPTGVPTVA